MSNSLNKVEVVLSSFSDVHKVTWQTASAVSLSLPVAVRGNKTAACYKYHGRWYIASRYSTGKVVSVNGIR